MFSKINRSCEMMFTTRTTGKAKGTLRACLVSLQTTQKDVS